jgi:hypothetical protein
MPLIPAGTKFEAIKPTTNVNRRSALVNANDLTYTIADIAATVGGNVTVPFTNAFPKVNNLGNFVASKLYEFEASPGEFTLAGNYSDGINITGTGIQNFANLLTVENVNKFLSVGDVNGTFGLSYGINLSADPGFSFASILIGGVSNLTLTPALGEYNFGGATTKFGIINADIPQCSLSVSSDLVVDILGTKYIKVDVSGTVYNIALVL